LVSRYHDMSGGRMALGTALLDLTRLAHTHRTPVPSAMTLVGKAMLNLDGTIRVLSPELDPVQLIRDWMLDLKHLAENSPRRAEMILDKLANDQLTIRLEIEPEAVATLNRAAGRLSLGMIAGSLIVGGGLVLSALMQAERSANGAQR